MTANDSTPAGPTARSTPAADIDGGNMDGFIGQAEHAKKGCTGNPQPELRREQTPDVMGYTISREIPNYWTYARNFVLQDHLFEPNASWSLPAHLFMVSGWSAKCTNPGNPMSCTTPLQNPGPSGGPEEPPTRLCLDRPDLPAVPATTSAGPTTCSNGTEPDCDDDADGLHARATQRRRTSRASGTRCRASTRSRQDGQTGNVQTVDSFSPPLADGTLPAVAWVVPNGKVSEHPPALCQHGQAYVTGLDQRGHAEPRLVSTAIFLAWDDWGGFYDHVVPPVIDQNGYGLRVPGHRDQPLCPQGFIDHQTLSFDAYLKFIEDDFLGGALDPKTDGRPDPRPTFARTRRNSAIW